MINIQPLVFIAFISCLCTIEAKLRGINRLSSPAAKEWIARERAQWLEDEYHRKLGSYKKMTYMMMGAMRVRRSMQPNNMEMLSENTSLDLDLDIQFLMFAQEQDLKVVGEPSTVGTQLIFQNDLFYFEDLHRRNLSSVEGFIGGVCTVIVPKSENSTSDNMLHCDSTIKIVDNGLAFQGFISFSGFVEENERGSLPVTGLTWGFLDAGYRVGEVRMVFTDFTVLYILTISRY